MARPKARSACRHDVNWPVRVKGARDTEWLAGRVINLSVTGVLLEIARDYRVGDRVEVEIDFMAHPASTTVVAGVGLVVRTEPKLPGRTAVQFAVECGLSHRDDAGSPSNSRFM